MLAHYLGDYTHSMALFEAVHGLHSSEGNLQSATWALSHMAMVAKRLGEYQRATALLEQVLPAHREHGDLQRERRAIPVCVQIRRDTGGSEFRLPVGSGVDVA